MGVMEQDGGGYVLGGHVVSEPGQPLAPHPANVVGQMIFYRRHSPRMPHSERRWHYLGFDPVSQITPVARNSPSSSCVSPSNPFSTSSVC